MKKTLNVHIIKRAIYNGTFYCTDIFDENGNDIHCNNCIFTNTNKTGCSINRYNMKAIREFSFGKTEISIEDLKQFKL